MFVIQLISILSKDDKMFTSYFHPEVVFSRKYCQIKIIIPVQHYANSRIEVLQWKGILVALRSSFLLRVLEFRNIMIILNVIQNRLLIRIESRTHNKHLPEEPKLVVDELKFLLSI